jgi:phospholipid/cholesterol/gamma-HCH transport system substrate-binding protein
MPVRVEELLPRAVVILDNLAETTTELRDLVGGEEFQKNIRESAKNVEKVTARLTETVAAIQGTVIRSQGDIDAIVSNLRLASSSVRDMTANLEGFVMDPNVHDNLRGTLASVRRSAETLEGVATSVEQTAKSVEGLVTAPEFQDDVRQTVSEARQTVEEARDAVGRVNRLLGGGGGPSLKVPSRGTNLDMLYVPDDARLRAELATSIPLSGNRFLELGLYDLGISNKLILQAGKPLGSRTDLRYGLYASRLGIGLDYNFSPRSFGRLDFFDTEKTRLNMRAGYRFSDSLGMLVGVDDLLGQNKATMGLQFSR